MNLDRLHALVCLQTHGSLAKAAQSSGISQGTLRGRLTALEDEVGVRLMGRGGRLLELTPAGVELASGGRDLIDEAEQAIHRVASRTEDLVGSFRVAIPLGLPPALLVMVLRYGHVRYPKLRSLIFPVARPLSSLPDEADIALTFEPRPRTGPWLSARLAQAEEGLFAAPEYLARRGIPESVDALETHDLFSWVPPDREPDQWPLWAGGGFGVGLSHASPDMGLMRRCALEGLGIARVPKGEIPDPDTSKGALVPVLAELVGRKLELRVVMPDSPRMRRPFRAFFGNIREGVSELDDG